MFLFLLYPLDNQFITIGDYATHSWYFLNYIFLLCFVLDNLSRQFDTNVDSNTEVLKLWKLKKPFYYKNILA